jgi:UDP-N-acetylmuramyl pentapeptide phosphotransferase/UDP-N-acetylglucosamine-1-phosphate transferase
MYRYFVLPTDALPGWELLIAFVAVLTLGLWPVIGWINHAPSLLGMPTIVVWIYVVVFASCRVMAVANRSSRIRIRESPIHRHLQRIGKILYSLRCHQCPCQRQ